MKKLINVGWFTLVPDENNKTGWSVGNGPFPTKARAELFRSHGGVTVRAEIAFDDPLTAPFSLTEGAEHESET